MAKKDRNKRGWHVVKYLLCVVSTHKGIGNVYSFLILSIYICIQVLLTEFLCP